MMGNSIKDLLFTFLMFKGQNFYFVGISDICSNVGINSTALKFKSWKNEKVGNKGIENDNVVKMVMSVLATWLTTCRY